MITSKFDSYFINSHSEWELEQPEIDDIYEFFEGSGVQNLAQFFHMYQIINFEDVLLKYMDIVAEYPEEDQLDADGLISDMVEEHGISAHRVDNGDLYLVEA